MSITVRGLSFAYGGHVVLDNIDLTVPAGERIGIVGVSGGGKSTLLKLLSGLYAPQCGTIIVEGATEPDEIRRRVSMVMQSALLFPASIRENITCGHPLPELQVEAAVRAAQLTSWVATLPEGLDTCVGERGSRVSGGQAQRIAIARAIAKDAPVVLLDEATSALDGETSDAVLAALRELTQGRTVVSVTHRPETLDGCNRVLRLEGGRLYEA